MEMNHLDKSNYLRGLLLLIGKDKKITIEEKEIVINIGTNLGFAKDFCKTAIDELLENEHIVDTPPMFSDQSVAKEFITDGLKIAFADKKLHMFELQWLIAIAKSNNISHEWVAGQLDFYQKSENEFEEDSNLGLIN